MAAKKAEFLGTLKFANIRLRNLDIRTSNELYSHTGEREVSIEVLWRKDDEKIESIYETRITLNAIVKIFGANSKGREELISISCSIESIYNSQIQMTDRLFNIFRKNLFITHAWPYLRELLHNISFRVGIEPLILPTVGTLLRSKA